MWLTLDIGNSAAKGGLYAGGTLERVFHVDLQRPALQGANAEKAWIQTLREVLQGMAIERVGMASVVPSVVPSLTAALERLTGVSVERVHPSMHLPFDLAYHTPETLGMDRLAAAAAAWTAYGRAGPSARHVVAIDAGTATTLDVITCQGVYAGGIIGPGPALLRHALHDGTDQLPEVPLEWPAQLIGRSTREGLQSGLMIGFVESVRGLLARITAALEGPTTIAVTGGWRALLAREIDAIDHVDPHLVLEGVRVLMQLNPLDAPSNHGPNDKKQR
jgi:type III pantothenate kinase